MNSILNFQLLQNSLGTWLQACVVACLIILAGRVAQKVLSGLVKKWARKTKSTLDDFIVATLEQIRWEWVAAGIFAASRYLSFSAAFDKWMLWLFALVLLNRAIRIINALMDFLAEKMYLQKEGVDMGSKGAIKHILLIVKIAVAGVMIVIALDNLGFDIGAVVAGLGVTGIVIGLAVQNIVGDLFSSFCIIFDKPFEVGDFIIVGDFMGVVERIGIKTTRITSLGGEQIVFSNSDLTGSRIRNYKRMAKRRVAFGFGVVYSTAEEKLKAIPETVKGIIGDIEKTTFDRAHFQKFGASSLDFEVVYYVLSSDYNVYMDIQQKINLGIFSSFNKDGIEFAFPTQTLHVKECRVVQ